MEFCDENTRFLVRPLRKTLPRWKLESWIYGVHKCASIVYMKFCSSTIQQEFLSVRNFELEWVRENLVVDKISFNGKEIFNMHNFAYWDRILELFLVSFHSCHMCVLNIPWCSLTSTSQLILFQNYFKYLVFV